MSSLRTVLRQEIPDERTAEPVSHLRAHWAVRSSR
jgi:hypothetical protein